MSNSAMTVPALSQSTEETMSCPTSYAVQTIKGSKSPGGMQSARGLEVHHVSSLYINHCATRKVPADWARFDELALGSGAEAADILTGIRDNYVVDFEHVYDTELWLAIDHNWKAVDVPLAVRSMTREAREAWAAANGVIYHGTLDGLYFPTQARARIEDFKSHPRPFEANTIQSKRYALLIFINFPEVEEVTFELIFVRYANCRRSVTYTREDLPWMRQQVINARARQERLHERYDAGETLEAYPGAHCTYCPLLKTFNGCPISEFNEYATHTLEERARFAIWVEQVNKVNKQVLRDAVDASGKPIELKDGNGRLVQFGFNERESTQFPLLKTLPFLFEHRDTYEGDVEWIGNLVISSTKLKGYLKAKKRAITHQAIMDSAAVTITKTKFEAILPAETDESEPVALEWED